MWNSTSALAGDAARGTAGWLAAAAAAALPGEKCLGHRWPAVPRRVDQVGGDVLGILVLEPHHLGALLEALSILGKSTHHHKKRSRRISPSGKPYRATNRREDVYPVGHLPSFSPHLVG